MRSQLRDSMLSDLDQMTDSLTNIRNIIKNDIPARLGHEPLSSFSTEDFDKKTGELLEMQNLLREQLEVSEFDIPTAKPRTPLKFEYLPFMIGLGEVLFFFNLVFIILDIVFGQSSTYYF